MRCDLCNKKILKEPIIAGIGILNTLELCEKCGAPILKFLKKHKVDIENKKKRILQKSKYI